MADDRKTKPTDASADDVIAAVGDERRRTDAQQALALMCEVTGVEPVVWGPSMIGFGIRPSTTGKGRLYVKRMSHVDEGVLRELVERSWSADADA